MFAGVLSWIHKEGQQIRTHLTTWRAHFMAVDLISAYALHYLWFRRYLAILCIEALCIYQQDDWEDPSAAHMLVEDGEVIASGLDHH